MCRKKILLLLILSFLFNISIAQNIKKIPDSLKNLSFDNYREKIYNNQKGSLNNNLIYAKSSLLKAKNEKNTREIIYSYDMLAEIFEDFDKSIKYSDTAIRLANKKYPIAIPYLYSTRGYLYYNKKKLKESLNCFLIAMKDTAGLSHKLRNNINYSIGLIKKTQGNYREAIPIYQKCMDIAYNNKDDNYLRYLLGLAELYNRTDQVEISEKLTKQGIIECSNYTFGEFYLPYFISNRGKNNFLKKNWDNAISDLKSALKNLKKNDDFF